MKIKTKLLIAAFAALIALPAQAALTLTISPIEGDANNYLLQASGTGDVVVDANITASIFLDTAAFVASTNSPQPSLSFGGESFINISPQLITSLVFEMENALPSGSAYSFSGGSTIVALTSTYAATFNVGNYTITSGSNFFGPNPGGTLTVLANPIPEPSTYAALAGLGALAFVAYRRKRSA